MTLPRLRDALPYLAIALLLAWGASERCVGRLQGAALQRARAERDSARVAERRALQARAAAETVYVRDTLRLRAVRVRTDTVLQSLQDTVLHVDTVRVLVAAERAACDAALLSCSARVAAADSTTAAVRRQLRATERLAGLQRRRWFDRAGLCAGYGVTATPGGQFSHGVQAGVCVKAWP